MSSQKEKAERFAALHIPGKPVILFNVWDAGSAQAVADAGAKAIATGSWSVAAAHGLFDAEALPLDLAVANIARIVKTVDLPVTLDFEGGYATDLDTLKTNIAKVVDTGAIGINFEDQIIGGEGLHSSDDQCRRIAAIRGTARAAGLDLFINARTDVFLKSKPTDHSEHLREAIIRGNDYGEAGASGFFAPGLKDAQLIGKLCDEVAIPVNIMVMSDTPSNAEMAALGVARISYGPGPYRHAMETLKTAASEVF